MHESDSIRLHQQRVECLLCWLLFVDWFTWSPNAKKNPNQISKHEKVLQNFEAFCTNWALFHGLQTIQLGSGLLWFFLLCCCCTRWETHGEMVQLRLTLLTVLFPKRARWGVCASAQECQNCRVRAKSSCRATPAGQTPTCNSGISVALRLELVQDMWAKRQHVW